MSYGVHFDPNHSVHEVFCSCKIKDTHDDDSLVAGVQEVGVPSQFSVRKVGTRENSFVFAVTRVISRARTCAAISKSLGPMGVPWVARYWRICP